MKLLLQSPNIQGGGRTVIHVALLSPDWSFTRATLDAALDSFEQLHC